MSFFRIQEINPKRGGSRRSRRPRGGDCSSGFSKVVRDIEDLEELKEYINERENGLRHPKKNSRSGGDFASTVVLITILSPFIAAAEFYALAYAFNSGMHLLKTAVP